MEEEKIIVKKEALPPKPKNFMQIGLIALSAVLAITCGWLGYSYMTLKNDNQNQLERVAALESELSLAKKAKPKVTPTLSPTPVPIKDNIEAAIGTMNTATLEGYIASSVTVVLAASEFGGPRTPAQAITDLNYLSSATGPWDFDLPADVISAYQSGFYAQYFPDGAIVGKSSDNYIVSFGLNEDGDIDQIFMAVAEVL